MASNRTATDSIPVRNLVLSTSIQVKPITQELKGVSRHEAGPQTNGWYMPVTDRHNNRMCRIVGLIEDTIYRIVMPPPGDVRWSHILLSLL